MTAGDQSTAAEASHSLAVRVVALDHSSAVSRALSGRTAYTLYTAGDREMLAWLVAHAGRTRCTLGEHLFREYVQPLEWDRAGSNVHATCVVHHETLRPTSGTVTRSRQYHPAPTGTLGYFPT
ncbi:hypothetical protein GCM10020229_32120 [Kitasatospora albolonga]